MPTIYTRNGKAQMTAAGALIAGDCCDCFDPANRCACGSACSIAVTSYKFTGCKQGTLGYNHSELGVGGALNYDSCCLDCAHRAAARGITFGGNSITFGWPGDASASYYVQPGDSSTYLYGRTFAAATPIFTELPIFRYAQGFHPATHCETALGDLFDGLPWDDERPSGMSRRFTPRGSFLANVPGPVKWRHEVDGVQVDEQIPFFRTLGPGTSYARFTRYGGNCNAQNCKHEWTFLFTSAPGLRMTVSLRGGGAWADVANGATSTYTYSAGLYASGSNFTMDIVVTAA